MTIVSRNRLTRRAGVMRIGNAVVSVNRTITSPISAAMEKPMTANGFHRLTVVEKLVSVSPEKRTRLGVGHFVETLDTFSRQDGAVVATNRNTLFRFTPGAQT